MKNQFLTNEKDLKEENESLDLEKSRFNQKMLSRKKQFKKIEKQAKF